MSAYLGNTANRIISSKRNDVLESTDWLDVARAQAILKTRLSIQSQERCVDLIQQLYKSVIQTHIDGQGFVRNATNTVLNWNDKVDTLSLSFLRRLYIMRYANQTKGDISKLQKWQYDLIDKIILKPDIINIKIFDDSSVNYFWVTILDDATSSLMEYSKDYIDVLSEYGSLNCDFMVFGKNEIDNCQIPENAISINIREL